MALMPMEIEKVDDITVGQTVDDIAGNPRVHHNRNDIGVAENLTAFPDEDGEREDPENRQRPYVPLKHPPRAAAVLDVREIEESVNHQHQELLQDLVCAQ